MDLKIFVGIVTVVLFHSVKVTDSSGSNDFSAFGGEEQGIHVPFNLKVVAFCLAYCNLVAYLLVRFD